MVFDLYYCNSYSDSSEVFTVVGGLINVLSKLIGKMYGNYGCASRWLDGSVKLCTLTAESGFRQQTGVHLKFATTSSATAYVRIEPVTMVHYIRAAVKPLGSASTLCLDSPSWLGRKHYD